MFKRKQDVDKHVSSILSRRKGEKEKNAQGFQIARLYVDIKEYAIAKRYLSGFLHVRENVPQAHQLMGEINEATGEIKLAVDNYRRALDLGGFGSSNRQLVLKICQLYCQIGTDVQRMKYWLERCEKLFPKSDIVFKLKAQIAEAGDGQDADASKEMENLVVSELVNRPTDLSLRIKLLNMYLDSERYEEAYDAAVSTDLTTAFSDRLQWFECLQSVFQLYGEKVADSKTDPDFNQHYLHVLRNLTYLSLASKEVADCVQNLERFDRQLKQAVSLVNHSEEWTGILNEMKGQMFFLAGLLLLKRAKTGSVSWQDVNQLAGACFLASRSVEPIDAQAVWFVRAPHERTKFYNWWHLESYDRISQVGHMLQQLSQNDVIDWSNGVRQRTMTAAGHQRVFKVLYAPKNLKSQGEASFFYQAGEMVEARDLSEPLTYRHLIDVDRVAYQVHLNSLSHLVWLCLQRYSSDMEAQPNYHFSIMENIQYSVKNMDNGAGESLCQLDILVFLLAAVRCAASESSDRIDYEDNKGKPSYLPVCLSKPLCTQDQEEWWTAAYKFCTNSVKEDFSRLRRVLIRGIETVRLIGPHGVSVSLMAHLARSLDAKVKSFREAEYGCRCPVYELTALENRAGFYWEKTKKSLEKLQRNQHSPIPKNRLFKETGDLDIPLRKVEKLMAEAKFALALVAMRNGQHQKALEGFEAHKSPWAKYYCAMIYKTLAERDGESESVEGSSKRKALIVKARDSLCEAMDSLNGDKGHELNILVSREMDDVMVKIHGFEWGDEVDASFSSSFHTPVKSPSDIRGSASSNGIIHSTPRNPSPNNSLRTNGVGPSQSISDANHSIREHVSSTSEKQDRPRPSPERLDAQIKSLSYSQSSLFKMILDRNEELIMINGKMMEELRDNNNQLKAVLTDNKTLMGELKTFLGENRDMMKQIKTELSSLKPALIPPQAAPVPPAPPLFMPHMPTPPPRGPYPGFPPQGQVVPPPYAQYMINSQVPPTQPPGAGPQYRPSGLPGSKSPNVGKYRPQSEDEEEEEEDLSNVEEAAALYADFFDSEQSYSHYFTPDSQVLQDWSMGARSGIEAAQPPMPLPPLQPRMGMPAPGYFASALRGQSLQYAQGAQGPGQMKPVAPGPGFFSSPVTSGVGTPGGLAPTSIGVSLPAAPGIQGLASTAVPISGTTQSPALMAALTGQKPGISTGTPKPESTIVAPGIKILLQAKAVLEPSKSRGDISILVDLNNNRATILMMGDGKDIIFHHDINGLKLEPSFVPSSVIWTGIKVGSASCEKVHVTLDSPVHANQLKDAIQLATAMLAPKTSTPQVPSSTTPKLFNTVTATSTPVTTTAATGSATSLASSKGPAKQALGGFTFTGTPNITPVGDQEKAKAESHQTPAASSKADAPKPFSGFSLTPSSSTPTSKPESQFTPFGTPDTGKAVTSDTDKTKSPFTSQKSPGVVPKSPGMVPKSPGGGEDEHVEEYEPNVDFKPVIALPELVEKKTGEENEIEVFVERCRLFRFDLETKQWKERGIGELKILKSKDQVKFRIIMRRDQILKLCANHYINADIRLTPMASSDRAWCYSVMDFSEEEMKMEQLAVKFKNAEKAKHFQEVFTDCCRQLKEDGEKEGVKTEATEEKTPVKIVAAADSTSGKTQEKPKAPEVTKPVAGFGFLGSASSKETKSLSEMFKPKAGSWECQGCLVRNNADVIKCPACSTLKPGAKPEDVPKEKASSGFSFVTKANQGPAGTGFKFGAATTTANAPATGGFSFTPASPSANAAPQGGFKFGQSASASTPASGFSFKTPTAPATPTSSTEGVKAPAGGFTFKPAATTTTAAATSNLAVTTTTPSTASAGFSFNTSTTVSKPGFSMGTSSTPFASFGAAATTTAGTTTSSNTAAGFSFGSKPSSGFSFAPPSKDGTNTQGAAAKPPAGSEGLLAKLLTSDDSGPEGNSLSSSKATGGFNFSMPSKTSTPFTNLSSAAAATASSGSQGFNFSFTKSPSKPQQPAAIVPGSPEVDEHGMYVNKEGDDSHIHFEPVVALPDKVEVKTGEEDEIILFEARGKLYRFVSGEWKEKGVGVVKILEHKESRKARVLMRRDQVLKICCNHKIEPSLNLQAMAKTDGKAWIWYALDFSENEGKMEQLALRFRNADIAGEFKKVFDKCRDAATSSPPKGEATPGHQGQGDVTAKETEARKELFRDDRFADDDTDDVIFVGEDKPTAEQVAKARQFQLPDAFYLYESKPPCPGCLGCVDGDVSALASLTTKPAPKVLGGEKTAEPTSATKETIVFGGPSNLPDFASLTSDAPSGKGDTGNGFMFGSGTGVDFSSLAASGKVESFATKVADGSSPFKFAGAGQRLFGAGGDHEGGDDSGVAPSEDIHFEPVIPLPDLVEVKTGEEDWTALFCCRAKLYKFDANQWKERGIGEMKIMSHNTDNMFRVLQRREQVLKVACNHLITTDMEIKPMSTSETSWCWVANDCTDSEPVVSQFAVKFKTKDIAEQFKNVFESCQEKLRHASSAGASAQSQQQQQQAEAAHDEENEEEYDEDDDEEDEKVLFEKRATLNSYENGAWKKLGVGILQVTYNEDLNGNSVIFTTDSNEKKCSHVIAREQTIVYNPKNKSCEWRPIDYVTDEPIRRHFSASFSSGPAAEEFVKVFNEGQRLAVDSDLSENLPSEIVVPEIFSKGEPGY